MIPFFVLIIAVVVAGTRTFTNVSGASNAKQNDNVRDNSVRYKTRK